VAAKGKKDKWLKINSLVPLVDFINTGFPDEINTICQTHSNNLAIECVAQRDISQGEEVFV